MAKPPAKIGKYEVRSLIGRGAMGAVYLGHDPFIDRPVAIKVCEIEISDDDVPTELARKMFFNEAQAAGALDNPNIVRIYDAGDADGKPYLVMEYIEGADTLKSYTRSDNLLPIKEVLRLMHQCAEGLDYAHRRGVLHRDIKPANLILSKDGEVKIGDFGVAQRTHSDKTQLMGQMGTPMYMSPEQARDDTLTSQTDLYSLGVVMYEMLTGTVPYQNVKTLAGLINKVVNQEPTPVRKIRKDVPEPLGKIVARAMEKQLDKRYKTGGEIASDIAKLLEEPGPPSKMTEEQKFDAVRGLNFFSEFSDDDIQEVLEASTWEQYKSGDRIITEGAIDHSFFVIVSGDVSVLVGDTEISKLATGDCIGELGYLTKVKRTASVVATGNVTVMKIDSSIMEWASLPCQMCFNKAFQKTLVERLYKTNLSLASSMAASRKTG